MIFQWLYHEDLTPVDIRSQRTNHRYYNVKISRRYRNISMIVRDKIMLSDFLSDRQTDKLMTSSNDKLID